MGFQTFQNLRSSSEGLGRCISPDFFLGQSDPNLRFDPTPDGQVQMVASLMDQLGIEHADLVELIGAATNLRVGRWNRSGRAIHHFDFVKIFDKSQSRYRVLP